MTEQAGENRSEYTVSINGIDHTVLLTDEEAKAQKATKSKAVETTGVDEATKEAVKSSTPANKARTARDK